MRGRNMSPKERVVGVIASLLAGVFTLWVVLAFSKGSGMSQFFIYCVFGLFFVSLFGIAAWLSNKL